MADDEAIARGEAIIIRASADGGTGSPKTLAEMMGGLAKPWLLNDDGEVEVQLADGWSLRSGVYDPDAPDALTSGEYVRLCRPDGTEYVYWDMEEWKTDPAVVMGAIINSAAGFRLEEDQ